MNRSKKAILNLVSQFLLQVTTAICGFIVPKLILEAFGSEVNGLVSSITQFLAIITLMETGVGSVAKTAFYKPLASGDGRAISGVYNATESFFRKIAAVFAAYCVILSVAFPFINESGFDFWFTASLVLILGITSFAQYYFGMSYTLALNADQLSFISAFLQIGAVIANAVLIVIILKLGAGIHVVKLVSASVFVLKPVIINLYGYRKYRVDKSVPKDNDSLAQKWDNLAQGIATYVHTKIPYIFTTVFLSLKEVSVYSVYSLITASLSAVITSISTGFVSGLGNMYAKKEEENFRRVFSLYEFVNTITTFSFFTIAAITIMQFVRIYTENVTDADYERPLFAMILIIGEVLYCLRLPYHYAIANAGHFKQTKRGAYIEVIINVVLSLCLMPYLGIVGLAVGTAIAMAYRTLDLIIYCSRNITNVSALGAIKRIALNIPPSLIAVLICSRFTYVATGFVQWAIYAAIVAVVTFACSLAVNILFYKNDFKLIFVKFKNVFSR